MREVEVREAEEPAEAARAVAVEPALPQVVRLQRSVGNRATTALVLARREAAPNVLRNGSTGDPVYELQAKLNSLDEVSTALDVDGQFGSETAKAVRQFQGAHPPLKADGEVGPLTAPALDQAVAEPQDTKTIASKVFDLGARAYSAGRYGHAYDFFTRTEELHPGTGAISFSRAQALRRLGGRRKEAIALFEQYFQRGGGAREKDANEFLAELRAPARTGDDAKDRAAAEKIFNRAAKFYAAGDYAHAADEFERTRELMDVPELQFSEAQAVRRMGGQRERAIKLYESYLASSHGKRATDARSGIDELKGVKTGDAAADKEAASKAFGKGATAYGQGGYLTAADRFAKSGDLLDAPEIAFSQAQALRKAGGHRDEAIALYDQYLASGHAKRARDARFYRDLLATQGAAP